MVREQHRMHPTLNVWPEILAQNATAANIRSPFHSRKQGAEQSYWLVRAHCKRSEVDPCRSGFDFSARDPAERQRAARVRRCHCFLMRTVQFTTQRMLAERNAQDLQLQLVADAYADLTAQCFILVLSISTEIVALALLHAITPTRAQCLPPYSLHSPRSGTTNK